MDNHTLPADQLEELRNAHRVARSKREADRIMAACEEFFANPASYRGELRSLLTQNFAIIGE